MFEKNKPSNSGSSGSGQPLCVKCGRNLKSSVSIPTIKIILIGLIQKCTECSTFSRNFLDMKAELKKDMQNQSNWQVKNESKQGGEPEKKEDNKEKCSIM
uniref:Uncharacterized protein n=1 Tax=Caenorhabditis tropicalis TaxID=1561998 RepID=A0A1I7UF29_9PELO